MRFREFIPQNVSYKIHSNILLKFEQLKKDIKFMIFLFTQTQLLVVSRYLSNKISNKSDKH